jgi:DNA-binding XRE family transcriptional regulator
MRTLEEVMSTLPPARRKRIEKRAAQLIAEELTLRELRKARKITQTQMARKLGVKQEQISRIERRTDLHISTLRRSVEALGGSLSLVAEFPDVAPVKLSGLSDLSL